MLKNLLISFLLIFLLVSCSNKKEEIIVKEPTKEEQATSVYAEAVEALNKGDVIKSIGRRIIENKSDYFDMVKNYSKGDTIMMKIVRNNSARYIAFTIK